MGKKLIYNSNDKSFMDDLGTKYYFDITIFIKPEILLGEKKILIKKKNLNLEGRMRKK